MNEVDTAWPGFSCIAFVIDVFRRGVVGWSLLSSLRSKASPLPALAMAAWSSGDATYPIHHSDQGWNNVCLL